MKTTLPENKQYKLFLVEVDDDDRERVLSGLTETVSIDTKYFYDIPNVLYSSRTTYGGVARVEYTLEIQLKPRPDGTYFIIENFMEENDERND